MPYEKSAGAIIFKIIKGEPRYLLLQHSEDYWNFPKGLVKKGEEEIETAKREIFEETGLKELDFLPDFLVRDHYIYRRKDIKKGHKTGLVVKDVYFYLARTKSGRIKVSWEHQGYKWVRYEEAMKLLKYPGVKKALEKAHSFLLDYFSKSGRKTLAVL